LDRIERLLGLTEESIIYLTGKLEGVTRDRYFADRDIRSILDKTVNDITLSAVDIAEDCLKTHHRQVPETYRDTILACHEFLGDIVLKVAPLVKHRNEMIHQSLKVNWQNIVTVRNRIPDIRLSLEAVNDLRGRRP
jgi:uncharacterized protein YutE (UPF0331/DUF86 family)